MFNTDTTSLTSWITTIDPVAGAVLTTAAALAFLTLNIIARRTTATARARARQRALTRDTERAARRAERARQRANARSFLDVPAARRAVLALVAACALAATILSVHGVQDALTAAGLTDPAARAAGVFTFEGVVVVAALLSWWHRTTNQPGFNIYGAAVWGGAAVLAIVGYIGGGHWLYSMFAPIAALAFHWLTHAERRRRGVTGGILTDRWERIKQRFTVATSTRTTRDRAEQCYSRVVARAVAAHRATRIAARARRWWFERATADAEARGLLDEGGRAIVAERVAARFQALDALSPAALADMGELWRPKRTQEAPAMPTGAPSRPSAPPTAPARARVRAVPVVDDATARAAITAHLRADGDVRDTAVAWTVDYWDRTGRLPSGRELAGEFERHEATGRKWLAPVRDALAAARSASDVA